MRSDDLDEKGYTKYCSSLKVRLFMEDILTINLVSLAIQNDPDN